MNFPSARSKAPLRRSGGCRFRCAPVRRLTQAMRLQQQPDEVIAIVPKARNASINVTVPPKEVQSGQPASQMFPSSNLSKAPQAKGKLVSNRVKSLLIWLKCPPDLCGKISRRVRALRFGTARLAIRPCGLEGAIQIEVSDSEEPPVAQARMACDGACASGTGGVNDLPFLKDGEHRI